MQAMQKEGRTGFQMAYSQRDIDWLLKNGWQKVAPPEPAFDVAQQIEHDVYASGISAAPQKKKPGRPRK